MYLDKEYLERRKNIYRQEYEKRLDEDMSFFIYATQQISKSREEQEKGLKKNALYVKV